MMNTIMFYGMYIACGRGNGWEQNMSKESTRVYQIERLTRVMFYVIYTACGHGKPEMDENKRWGKKKQRYTELWG